MPRDGPVSTPATADFTPPASRSLRTGEHDPDAPVGVEAADALRLPSQ
ncbi:MAG: hypothetical protein U0Q14_02690 [Dermatophilaceae bacterium]